MAEERQRSVEALAAFNRPGRGQEETTERFLIQVLDRLLSVEGNLRHTRQENQRLEREYRNLKDSYDFLKIRNETLTREKAADESRLRHLREEYGAKIAECTGLKERIKVLEQEEHRNLSSGYGSAATPAPTGGEARAQAGRSQQNLCADRRTPLSRCGSADSLNSSRGFGDMYSATDDSLLSGHRQPVKRVLPPMIEGLGERPTMPPKYPKISQAPLASVENTPDMGRAPRLSSRSPRAFPRMGAGHRPSRLRRSTSMQLLTPLERGVDESFNPTRVTHATSEEKLVPSPDNESQSSSENEKEELPTQYWTEDSEQSMEMRFDVFERPHIFQDKRVYLRECCDVCGRSIKFGTIATKCDGCRQTCHQDCSERAEKPCAPRALANQKTPSAFGSSTSSFASRLADWCPATQPSIPHVIIHCVLHLERHHLDHEGLYRVSGAERQVSELLRLFKTTRSVPRLLGVDPAVISSCIKRFLRELKDELIPASSCREFSTAAISALKSMDANDGSRMGVDALQKAVIDLPGPHRDTLALLCRHWQRVTQRCRVNRMTVEALSSCLGPTIVGSCQYGRDVKMATREVDVQIDILRALLVAIPTTFWQQFVIVDPSASKMSVPQTPRFKEAFDMSRIGASTTLKRTQPRGLDLSKMWEAAPTTSTPAPAKLKKAARPIWK